VRRRVNHYRRSPLGVTLSCVPTFARKPMPTISLPRVMHYTAGRSDGLLTAGSQDEDGSASMWECMKNKHAPGRPHLGPVFGRAEAPFCPSPAEKT